MTRIFGTALATALTSVSAAGILALIAYDFVGADGMRAAWDAVSSALSTPARSIAAAATGDEFSPRKEIHFFEEVPIDGTDLMVTTGASFASVAAVGANKPQSQWCYVAIDIGMPGMQGHVALGQQSGDEAPVFAASDSLGSAGVAGSGLTADRLARLARSHCRFGKLNPLG